MPPVDDDVPVPPPADDPFILSQAVSEVAASTSMANTAEILDFIMARSSYEFVVPSSGNRCARAPVARCGIPLAGARERSNGPRLETAMPSPSTNRPSRKPRRAEPVQPDRPTRGADVEQPEKPEHDETESRERRQEQTDAALDNVREGYR
jgi:hypothetical protein